MTPYAILKVKYTDADDVIRRAYYALIRTEHPDSGTGEPTELWYMATEAYNTVKLAVLRIGWEAKLHIQARICEKCRGYGVTGSRVGGIGIKVCAACKGEGRYALS